MNFGTLGFFKYYGFFVESFSALLADVGFQANPSSLRIILPIGISFYTFQTVAYSIDVYRGVVRPTRDALAFFAFVSFFPQLVAGPIERASHLLPQFLNRRVFVVDEAKDGLRRILWGLLKKMVIADNLAPYVDSIFAHYQLRYGIVLLTAVFAFAVQIYCDFSGYSDIALGAGRLFGIRLSRNFASPYFSRDVAEFWRRWHITLSTWFRDYVFIPLGGSRSPARRRYILNILVTFTLSGLWHGANWTFVAWGLLNGLGYAAFVAHRPERRTDTVAAGRLAPTWSEARAMLLTNLWIGFTWIFFRSPSIDSALGFVRQIFSWGWLDPGGWVLPAPFVRMLPFVAILFAAEWLQREKEHALDIASWPRASRWAGYYAAASVLLMFSSVKYAPFIYFQF